MGLGVQTLRRDEGEGVSTVTPEMYAASMAVCLGITAAFSGLTGLSLRRRISGLESENERLRSLVKCAGELDRTYVGEELDAFCKKCREGLVSKEKKLCEDCKWLSCGRDWCCNPVGSKYEFVRRRDLVDYCFVERSKDGRCGPEGKLFEKKRSFWREMFSFWSM